MTQQTETETTEPKTAQTPNLASDLVWRCRSNDAARVPPDPINGNWARSAPLPVEAEHGEGPMSYIRFAAMIVTSSVVMFGLMYLNTYAADHVFFSQTRAWMTVVMAASMAVVMLLCMVSLRRRPSSWS